MRQPKELSSIFNASFFQFCLVARKNIEIKLEAGCGNQNTFLKMLRRVKHSHALRSHLVLKKTQKIAKMNKDENKKKRKKGIKIYW